MDSTPCDRLPSHCAEHKEVPRCLIKSLARKSSGDTRGIPIHTTESPSHGAIPLDEVIQAASRKGLRCIALTDHWKPETDPSVFSEERELIEQAEPKLKIFLSAEVSPLNIQGDTPVDPKAHGDILKKMDYLSAGPHQHEETLSKGKAEIIDRSHTMLMNILKDDLFSYVLHPWVTVIFDLFSRGRTQVLTFEDIPERYLDEFAEAAALYESGWRSPMSP